MCCDGGHPGGASELADEAIGALPTGVSQHHVPLQLQLAWQRSSAAVLHRTVRLRLQRAHPAVSSFTEPSYGLVAAGPAPAAAAAEQLVASRRRPPSQPAAAAAASPAPPAPASPDAQVGSETASASHQASSATLQESSATTVGLSPVSARSTGLDSAAASDSVVSRESWAARGGPAAAAGAEHVDHGRGSPVAGTLSAGLLQTGPAVRQRAAKRAGWRTPPPPAASDVSSSGQASVIDIMDHRFMGGI